MKQSTVVQLAALGLCALGGMALGWQMRPMPDPTYRTVTVHDTLIQAQAPDTVLRFIDRIKWRVVEPTVIARGTESVPTRLDAYCRPDTVKSADSTIKVTPVLPPSSGKYDGTTLSLFSVTSDSRLFAQETRVSAPFEWVQRGGVYEVRTTRSGFKLFRGLPKVLVPLAAGLAAGVILSK